MAKTAKDHFFLWRQFKLFWDEYHMSMLISRAAMAVAAIVLGVSGASAFTHTANGVLTVTANSGTVCAVSSASLNFGDISGIASSAVSGSTSISVTCTYNTPYSINFSSDSGSNRSLKGASNFKNSVNYNLFWDNSNTVLAGTDVGGTAYSGSGTGTAQSIPIYGLVFSASTPSPDAYSEAVTIVVSY